MTDVNPYLIKWDGLQQFETVKWKLLRGHDFDNIEHMKWSCDVYNMCTQRPPNNHTEKIYNEIRPFNLNLINELVDKYDRHFEKHDLDVKHKDFVLHLHYKYIIRWITRIFSYIERFYTKRTGLPSISDVLHQCWISKGRPTYTIEQEVDYMNEWKGLLRAKQKLQLAKSLNFPDDLYDIIIPHLSSIPVSEEQIFETLKIDFRRTTQVCPLLGACHINGHIRMITNIGLMD